jgi:DNA modification methylase
MPVVPFGGLAMARYDLHEQPLPDNLGSLETGASEAGEMIALPEWSVTTLDTVHCMDALTLLRALPSGSVDCVVTDPPYGIKKAEWDEYFPTIWLSEVWRVTNHLLIACGNPEMFYVAQQVGHVRSMIIMHSRNGMKRGAISFGNWFPVLACGEWDFQPRPNHISFNVSITETIDHPSPKPIHAMEQIIRYYTNPGDLICDPFIGSGTTAVAARNLGRHFIGCDISREYVDMARKRLAQPFTLPMFETVAAK